MSDSKTHETLNTKKDLQTTSFTRSTTLNPSPAQVSNKPLYNLYNTPVFQRSKNFYTSPFVSMVGKVRKLASIFETPKLPPNPNPNPNPKLLPLPSLPKSLPPPIPDYPFRLPGTENSVVIYYTSLRGIRRTFQDCHSIRMIFRNLRVNLDERDVSMDVAYREELGKVLGEEKNGVSLPQVFIKGKYIGGADVVKQLLEAGELSRLIKGLPLRDVRPCVGCDDVRFYPCTRCSGSRRVFDEEEDEVVRCPECNENGLVRCPLCCLS